MDVQVVRGRVVLPDAVLCDGLVVTDGDRIAWVGPWTERSDVPEHLAGALVGVEPTDELVMPGLVDLHCHGGGGASFSDATDEDEVRAAVAEHRRHGTTTMLASLVTAAPDALRRQVGLLAGVADSGEIAGIHVEGPFLAPAQAGAHDADLLLAPDPDLVDDLVRRGRGRLRTMTLAPELPGVTGPDGVAARLVAAGVLPSWGHTDADGATARAAVRQAAALLTTSGARATVTHLFNAMRSWHHRDGGPIGEFLAAARRGELVLELIGDGTHVAPDVVREVVEIAGRDAVVLVTDAMAAAGMADGDYRLGSTSVEVVGGVARVAGSDALAGGTAHLIDVVRRTVEAGVPLVDAVFMASAGPARVLRRSDRGRLQAGARADVVITDRELRVRRVLRAGKPVPSATVPGGALHA